METSSDNQIRHGKFQIFCRRLLDLDLLREDGQGRVLKQIRKQSRVCEVPPMQRREDRLFLLLSLMIAILV
jgi:hypothetical protein